MKRTLIPLVLAALPALGGGFYVELGSPSDRTESKAKGAAMLARLTGCHNPENGKLAAVAEGMVNGERRSIAIEPIALSTPGLYSIPKVWPNEGRWIVRIVGRHPSFDRPTSAVVRVSGDSFDRKDAKFVLGADGAQEAADMLR
ncbi:MAG: hypothetical protein SFV18_07780 [Bryobacteraceae bacterium]|nr:hypothetical protein [Bryobacteraceae bacterium]